jgi:hypothetical protein
MGGHDMAPHTPPGARTRPGGPGARLDLAALTGGPARRAAPRARLDVAR